MHPHHESRVKRTTLTHGFRGKSPMTAEIVAFNREKSGRIKYTIEVRFEVQRYFIYKYYNDFLQLKHALETSQFNDAAANLPKKHPLRLLLSIKIFSLTKRHGMRKEMNFIKHRKIALSNWVNALLAYVGPQGVDHVRFLDDFFEAFPAEESYNRATERTAHVRIERSMFHALKALNVPTTVYTKLWEAGYGFQSLRKLSAAQWVEFGVSPMLSATLFQKFRKYKAPHVAVSRNASNSSLLTVASIDDMPASSVYGFEQPLQQHIGSHVAASVPTSTRTGSLTAMTTTNTTAGNAATQSSSIPARSAVLSRRGSTSSGSIPPPYTPCLEQVKTVPSDRTAPDRTVTNGFHEYTYPTPTAPPSVQPRTPSAAPRQTRTGTSTPGRPPAHPRGALMGVTVSSSQSSRPRTGKRTPVHRRATASVAPLMATIQGSPPNTWEVLEIRRRQADALDAYAHASKGSTAAACGAP